MLNEAQGATRLALFALALFWCGVAQAQSDTTRPAISLNAADGTTTFTSLPSPLSGTVFDAGGMGEQLSARLFRVPNGTQEFWNGSAWSTTDKYWPAQVAPAGTAGDYNWSVSVPWPTGANLPRGSYIIHVSAFDNAGNSAAIERTLNVGAPDTTPPDVTIDTPADEHLIDSSQDELTSIAGTVGDGAGLGVSHVMVQLSRHWEGVGRSQIQSWDGTSWGYYGNWRYFAATLGAPDAAGVRDWRLSEHLPPREQLATGQYFITVLAYDYNGNLSVAQHRLHVAPYDDIAPTLEVTFPASGQQLTRLPEIRGTANDAGSGVSRVSVWLARQISGADGNAITQHWDAQNQSWGSGLAYFGALPDSMETSWVRNQNLPAGAALQPGQYTVITQAIDRYSNLTALYRNFSIVPVPPLSIDAHLRADASQGWLGEGFSNGDASGQTWSGTIASGETQSRAVRLVRHGGLDSKTVKVSIPDWAAFAAAGWTARFTNAGNGADITAEITGAQGWRTVMNDGDAAQFNVEVTAPASASAGQTSALTFRVEADPTSETNAIDVVKATWRVTAPRPDLAIRAEGGAWRGETVMNADGANQTIERVAKPGATLRGQIKLSVAEAANGQSVKWSVPAWDAFRAEGWTAKFFDAPQGGKEITDLITGEGWTTRHTEGFEPTIGWQVTAPASASDVTRELGVRAQVGGGASDVVKASVRVLANVQPDVSISALDEYGNFVGVTDEDGNRADWVGEGQLSPTEQRVAKVWGAGETHNFAVKIKNTGSQATPFQLSWPALPDGWQIKFYDALEEGTLLEGEIMTPSIEPYQSITWRAEVTANAPATQATLPIRFSGSNLFDEVEIDAAMQSLIGLQWSADGQSWQNVTDATLLPIEQNATIGVRGVKALPAVDWPAAQPMGPKWNWQGAKLDGDTVWLQGKTGTVAGGEAANATLGATFGAKIRVLPESALQLNLSRRELMAGSGPADLTTTTVSVRVTDAQGAPLANQKVRLRAHHEDESPAGSWQGGDAEPVATTDNEGNVSTVWTTDGVEGDVNFKATLLTDGGQERKFASHQSVNVNAPFATAKLGDWTEDENGWSRNVTVETWFGARKLSGLSVALASAVTDYETEAAVAGWENAAPFDNASGTSDAEGKFTTIQRWNPVEADAWPHDFEVTVNAEIL